MILFTFTLILTSTRLEKYRLNYFVSRIYNEFVRNNDFSHYEAKLCILCILSGVRNRPKSDLLRNPQHCYVSLIFYAVLDSTNKYLSHCTAQNRFKNKRFRGIRNCFCGIQNSLWNPQTNGKTFVSLN